MLTFSHPHSPSYSQIPKNIKKSLDKKSYCDIILTTNSSFRRIGASITLANPFLFFLGDCPSGGQSLFVILKIKKKSTHLYLV
jgi:hypothetical protein